MKKTVKRPPVKAAAVSAAERDARIEREHLRRMIRDRKRLLALSRELRRLVGRAEDDRRTTVSVLAGGMGLRVLSEAAHAELHTELDALRLEVFQLRSERNRAASTSEPVRA